MRGGTLLPLCRCETMGFFEASSFLPSVAAAVKSSNSGIAQLGFVMDPLIASVLGFFVFGQTLLPLQIAGMVLSLAAR